VTCSFLEDSGGVGGVNGAKISCREALLVCLVGVSDRSQMSSKPARDDTVEAVDADRMVSKELGTVVVLSAATCPRMGVWRARSGMFKSWVTTAIMTALWKCSIER
jgi:hypothetical protein